MDSPTSNSTRSIFGSLREPAYAMVLLLGTWYMLGELKSVLRPLLLAVFMGYVLLPTYTKLRKRWPVPLAMGLLVGGTSLILVGITLAVTGSLVDLTEQAPALKSRGCVSDSLAWRVACHFAIHRSCSGRGETARNATCGSGYRERPQACQPCGTWHSGSTRSRLVLVVLVY